MNSTDSRYRPQAHQDVEHLLLDARRARWSAVGDQQQRIVGQCDRDHHPLAHAAGELVRRHDLGRVVETHVREQRMIRRVVPLCSAPDARSARDLRLDRHDR